MLKRTLDILIGTVGLVLLAPLMLGLAVGVRLLLGSPVFFRQSRPGRHGVPFDLIKFRTMLDARAADGALLPDSERLTRFGKWLRRTSLDELPELVNVVRGEMSLVGPRPLLMEYLPLYSSRQLRRHDVRPGITGWAQVNGRNALSWEEKFEHDIYYVDNQSLWFDFRILWITIAHVIKGSGVSQPGQATAEAFKGSGMDIVKTASGEEMNA